VKPLRTIACFALVLLAGCNLSEPASHYEYQGPYLIITTDQGRPTPDVEQPEDMHEPPDMGPAGSPVLVFTELMLATSATAPTLGERGEYIEIKNVGDAPADPTKIVMILADPARPDQMLGRISIAPPATPEEIQVVSSLEPIGPGEYFVFVRFETAEAPVSSVIGSGRSYDYGRYASGPAMANDGPRQIELRYNEAGVIETFDTVRWENGRLVAPDGSGQGPGIEPDTALGVDAMAESPEGNDDPANWCLHTDVIGEGTSLGSPGASVDCTS
jgi:hypothetical protein